MVVSSVAVFISRCPPLTTTHQALVCLLGNHQHAFIYLLITYCPTYLPTYQGPTFDRIGYHGETQHELSWDSSSNGNCNKLPVDGVLVANIHPTQIGSPGFIMGNVGRGLRPL